MTQPPPSLSEAKDAFLAGATWQVRGTAMPFGSGARGAVAVTFHVPQNGFNAVSIEETGSGVVVTMLVNPDEARVLAGSLAEAAGVADGVGAPLFDEDFDPSKQA